LRSTNLNESQTQTVFQRRMWVPVLFWWESGNLHYSEKCAIRHLENAVHMYQQVTKQMIENSLLNKFKLEN